MKNDMYTYHYYRNRCFNSNKKADQYIIHAVIAAAICYLILVIYVG